MLLVAGPELTDGLTTDGQIHRFTDTDTDKQMDGWMGGGNRALLVSTPQCEDASGRGLVL